MSNTPYATNVLPLPAHTPASLPAIRKITYGDLAEALRMGWEDFKTVPTHAVMLALIYPILGLALARMVLGYAVLPLMFPLAAGFALVGPFAAIGLYELSRRREAGDKPSAWHALDVLRSPSFGGMLALGCFLMVLFAVWIAAAQAIYTLTFGYAPAASMSNFAATVLGTPKGWSLILIGCGVGFLFAVVALCISVVSFPMMLDRHASAHEAMLTSLKAVAKNPLPMAMWGLMVAALLVIGSLPFFLGLAVVVPVLGHATWHLYRKVIEPAASPYQAQPQPPKSRRYAADFPVNLFAWRRRDR